jgi:signal transduction histidine kinase
MEHLSNIEKALRKSKENLAEEIKKSGALIIEDLEVYEVAFPEVYLESVLYNLLSNAIKYRDEQKTPVIGVRSFSRGEYDCIEVTDNGIGIDMEKYGNEIFKYKKIFHKGYESNGLGLFITRSQVNSYGGEIQVSSGPGMGSSFQVRLKKYQSTNEAKAISA